MMPIPPSRASAIAKVASVTVSMAAETSGIFSAMLRESREATFTSRGRTSDFRGTRRTSSNVIPSPMNLPLRMSDICRNAGDVFTDDERVHFVGAFVRLDRFEIRRMPHHGILVEDAIRAEDLARHTGDFQGVVDVVALRHRHLLEPELSLVLQPAELEAEELRLRDFAQHVDKLLLRDLERGDRLAELYARLGILKRRFVAGHRRADAAPGDAVARLVQAHERRLEAFGLREDVFLRNRTVLED